MLFACICKQCLTLFVVGSDRGSFTELRKQRQNSKKKSNGEAAETTIVQEKAIETALEKEKQRNSDWNGVRSRKTMKQRLKQRKMKKTAAKWQKLPWKDKTAEKCAEIEAQHHQRHKNTPRIAALGWKVSVMKLTIEQELQKHYWSLAISIFHRNYYDFCNVNAIDAFR